MKKLTITKPLIMHCVSRVGWMKMCTVAALFLGYQMVRQTTRHRNISHKTNSQPSPSSSSPSWEGRSSSSVTPQSVRLWVSPSSISSSPPSAGCPPCLGRSGPPSDTWGDQTTGRPHRPGGSTTSTSTAGASLLSSLSSPS